VAARRRAVRNFGTGGAREMIDTAFLQESVELVAFAQEARLPDTTTPSTVIRKTIDLEAQRRG